ncbi:MAG: transglycosylase SLT domain-containing protein, partial [Crocinitomicaceae bacterium]
MKYLFTAILLNTFFVVFSQPMNWNEEKISVTRASEVSTILHAEELFNDRWDILPQAQFWKQIMTLSPDSILINVASTRQIIEKMSLRDWNKKTEEEKSLYRAEARNNLGLSEQERIYVTCGKNDFYKFKEVYPQLSKGVAAFERFGVDPWYAQAILLIESPGQLKKSISGAYGAFQLMPDVARAQGLTVNSQMDERKDFDRCAYGAARLINKICIPEAKRILDRHQLTYNENDLWFRLFVLHVYHAGAGNVSAVMNKIQPKEGSQEVIKSMWQNTAGGFGNNSQNYSQLALAAQLVLHDMVYEQCDDIKH